MVSLPARRLLAGGQVEGEGGPLPRLGLGGDGPAVALDDLLADGQADAHARGSCGRDYGSAVRPA